MLGPLPGLGHGLCCEEQYGGSEERSHGGGVLVGLLHHDGV